MDANAPVEYEFWRGLRAVRGIFEEDECLRSLTVYINERTEEIVVNWDKFDNTRQVFLPMSVQAKTPAECISKIADEIGSERFDKAYLLIDMAKPA